MMSVPTNHTYIVAGDSPVVLRIVFLIFALRLFGNCHFKFSPIYQRSYSHFHKIRYGYHTLKTLFKLGAAPRRFTKFKRLRRKRNVAVRFINRSLDSVIQGRPENAAVILKNNVPRYLILEFGQAEAEQLAADEDVAAISKRLIEKNRQAYEALAK